MRCHIRSSIRWECSVSIVPTAKCPLLLQVGDVSEHPTRPVVHEIALRIHEVGDCSACFIMSHIENDQILQSVPASFNFHLISHAIKGSRTSQLP